MKNKEQFTEVYDKYSRHLWAMLLGMGYDQNDLKSVLQETFLIVYRDFNHLKSMDYCKSWLIKVAILVAEKTARKKELAIDEIASIPSRSFLKAFSQLPQENRNAFCIRSVMDCTNDEIAEILNIGEQDVISRITKAQLMLREELERLETEESK